MNRTNDRVLLDPASLGLSEIPLVGRYRYTFAQPPLRDHAHPGIMELIFLARGSQPYRFLPGGLHLLRGGDVLVARPGEVHGTGRRPEAPGWLYWIQIRIPGPSDSFLDLPGTEKAALLRWLTLLPRLFTAPPRLQGLFDEILAPMTVAGALARLRLRTLILQVLMACMNRPTSKGLHLGNPVRSTMRFLQETSDRLAVSSLARMAGMSESHFKLSFKKVVGAPPGQYARLVRLQQAQVDLKKRNDTITAIALARGFASSQHFANAFRRQFGCAPRQYRAEARCRRAGRTQAAIYGCGVGFHPVAVATDQPARVTV
jgi:AraC-like DNA-binding protein